MRPGNKLMEWGAQLVLELPVRKLSLSELAFQLDQSNTSIIERLRASADSPSNRRQLCHMIGIERWGQRRVRVFTGEPYLDEEYDHYRPAQDRSWEDLKTDWDQARFATLAVVKSLSEANLAEDIKIFHNQYGPLSLKAWLRFLDVHATSEGKRVK